MRCHGRRSRADSDEPMAGKCRRYPATFDELVITWAKADPVITRAWIYGSRWKGTNRPDSDLDVAVEIDPRAYFPYGVMWFISNCFDDRKDSISLHFKSTFPGIPIHLEMYHPVYGVIPYSAICGAGLKPIYRRPRSERLPDTFRARPRFQF